MNRAHALTVVIWTLRLVCAGVLAQTLFFKFTGAAESRYIFERLGMEPWGRIATGVAEAIAVALLLTPRLGHWGAFVTLLVISGAVMSHLTKLGIVVQNDGGLLFGLAVALLFASASLTVLERHRLSSDARAAWSRIAPARAA